MASDEEYQTQRRGYMNDLEQKIFLQHCCQTNSGFSARVKSTTPERKLKMMRGLTLKPWYQSKTLTILVVLWALFTACLGIMIVVIFVQPHWITGKVDAKSVNFGLYRNCSDDLNDCSGSINDFSNIHSAAWKASTVFVAFSFTATFVSVAIMLMYWLCCFRSSSFGFRVSSGLQFTAGICLLITCLIYPIGWDSPAVKSVCGPEADMYKPGSCKVNWAYWIAIICMVDAFVLSYLSLMFIEREIEASNVASSRRSDETGTMEDGRTRRMAANGYYNQDTTTL
ncbi:LHFPL tetraspan subfamily member 3 protein-like [Montipora capricornis]|uniref:LHFPL tetraspan subfamily member 3 protein-like n=1 Tax=Montipora capricornis TaxID=246305 RepID=UPI0035F1574B